jgi:hypothetical protein
VSRTERPVFARRVFSIAGWYGLIVMLPQYFLEARIGRDYPPPITHPENFYGFIGITLAWQAMFLVIARDPMRFRPAMIPAVLEKVLFVIPMVILFARGRVASAPMGFVVIDFVLAILFTLSYQTTPAAERE